MGNPEVSRQSVVCAALLVSLDLASSASKKCRLALALTKGLNELCIQNSEFRILNSEFRLMKSEI